MARALVAALLSGLIMPGLGQLFNRQFKRGGLIIAGMSVLVVSLSVALFMSLRRAVLAFGDDLPPESERWSALAEMASSQDQTAVLVVLGLMAAMWLFAVIDAVRGGLKYTGRI